MAKATEIVDGGDWNKSDEYDALVESAPPETREKLGDLWESLLMYPPSHQRRTFANGAMDAR